MQVCLVSFSGKLYVQHQRCRSVTKGDTSQSSKGKPIAKTLLLASCWNWCFAGPVTKSGRPALRDSKVFPRTDNLKLPVCLCEASGEKPARHREDMQTAHRQERHFRSVHRQPIQSHPNSGQKKVLIVKIGRMKFWSSFCVRTQTGGEVLMNWIMNCIGGLLLFAPSFHFLPSAQKDVMWMHVRPSHRNNLSVTKNKGKWTRLPSQKCRGKWKIFWKLSGN